MTTASPKITPPLIAISEGQQRYLTATHGRLPDQVSAVKTGEYVALQAGDHKTGAAELGRQVASYAIEVIVLRGLRRWLRV